MSLSREQGAYSQYFIFFVTYELAQWVRVFGTCNPFQISVMKQSSLFGQFVSYEENGVLWIRYIFANAHNTKKIKKRQTPTTEFRIEIIQEVKIVFLLLSVVANVATTKTLYKRDVTEGWKRLRKSSFKCSDFLSSISEMELKNNGNYFFLYFNCTSFLLKLNTTKSKLAHLFCLTSLMIFSAIDDSGHLNYFFSPIFWLAHWY